MRRFLAGAALGLLVGLVVGIAGGSQFAADSSADRSRRGVSDTRGERAQNRDATGTEQGGAPGDAPLPSDAAHQGGRSGRVTRPEPVKRDLPEEEAPAEPKRTTAGLLLDVEALLGDDAPLADSASDAAAALVNRGDREPLPFALVLRALDKAHSRDDEGVEMAQVLVGGISLDDAAAALRAAIAGDEKLLWIAYELASLVTADDSLDFTTLSLELLASASADGRGAGVYLSQWADPPPVRALLRVAESDPHDETRAYALDIITDIAEESEDPAVRELIVPLVLVTAMQGQAESRRAAIEMFEEIGAAAAGTSLTLLREGGLDEDLAYYVVRPLLDAGRIDDVMRTDLTQAVAESVVWWAEEEDVDEEGDGARRAALVAPHAHRLFELGSEDSRGSMLYLLVRAGEFAALERIALLPDLDAQQQTMILEYLFTTETAPEGLQDELESHALTILAAYLDPERAGVEQRRRVAQSASWGGLEFGSQRTLMAAIAMMENAARSDPNSWVRDFAREAVEALQDMME